MPDNDAVSLAKRAEALKARLRTPEQQKRREEVDARNAALQSGPIKRGPNAHPDGTFGKTKS
jgi:hypothetical protein